jgi:hypothetical protein
MVENKIKKYRMGSFLTGNAKACNLGNFFDSVGWSKESLNRTIAQRDEADDNLALLTRGNDPDGSALQLIHSLFVGKDIASESPKLVGFLGYSNFEEPVKVPLKPAMAVTKDIRALREIDQGGLLPSGVDVLQSDTSELAEEFLDNFDPDKLSVEALAEAKRIPRSLLAS